MKNTASKLLLFLGLSTTLCSAQTHKLENFDSPERQKRIKELVEYVERNEMNPEIKGIASEFAVDTFKIEHFRRKFSKEDLDFVYNFYLKYVQILQFRLETLFFYYLEFEEFRY
jgi:Mn-dependent DtxR family transcriptional regulator